jgi:hypothetical protein
MSVVLIVFLLSVILLSVILLNVEAHIRQGKSFSIFLSFFVTIINVPIYPMK